MKRYKNETVDKRREKEKKRRITDTEYKLTCSLRTRTLHAFKAQNLIKNNKTLVKLGCSQQFVRRWIEFQLHGETTLENYGKVWHIEHYISISSFNFFNEDEMRKCFNWKNLKPMYSKDNIERVIKEI